MGSDSAAVAAFIEVAERFCAVVERARERDTGAFLAAAERALTLLYAAALELPAVEPSDTAPPGRAVTNEEWHAAYGGLQAALGRCDLYRDIYDPAAMADPSGAIADGDEPVVGSVADDLADIWRDLQDGLRAWEGADPQARVDIVWAWRDAFGYHWGQHLVNALRAIHWWRHVHYVGLPADAHEA